MPKKKPKEEKDYWKGIWAKALSNVPYRVLNVTYVQTVPCRDIPVPLFVALSARNNIRESSLITAYKYERRVLVKARQCKAPLSLFFALLGDFDRFSIKRLNRARRQGTEPTNPKRRELLLKMAESSDYAWDFLRKTGNDHLYTKECTYEEFGEIESILNPVTKRRW